MIRIVHSFVGDAGEVSDDTALRENSQPDFVISYRDGRRAVGEITSDTDPVLRSQWESLYKRSKKLQMQLPPGMGNWSVALSDRAHVNRLMMQLPHLLADLMAQGRGVWESYYVGWEPDLPPEIADLDERMVRAGVHRCQFFPGFEKDLAVFVVPSGKGDPGGDSLTVAEWMSHLLVADKCADVLAKVEKGEADERHVVLVAAEATPFLSDGPDWWRSPSGDPRVPGFVTHVWVIGRFTSSWSCVWQRGGGWTGVPPVTDASGSAGPLPYEAR